MKPRIRLASVTEGDLPRLFQWINDPDLVSLNAQYKPVSWEEHLEWFRSLEGRKDRVVFAVRLLENDLIIGVCQLRDIDSGHGSADLVIRFGEQEYRNKGLGTEAVGLLLDYGFKELDLHRIGLYVFEDNLRAIRAYEKAGFREEGRLKEAALINGERKDMLIMGVLRHEHLGKQSE